MQGISIAFLLILSFASPVFATEVPCPQRDENAKVFQLAIEVVTRIITHNCPISPEQFKYLSDAPLALED